MGDAPAAYITRPTAVEFRNKLETRALSAETIRNRLRLLRAVVNAYHLERGIDNGHNHFDKRWLDNGHNPFDKMPVRDKGQRVRARKARRPYHTSELRTIHASPVLTWWQAAPGTVRRSCVLVPSHRAVHGAGRIEELAQARLDDVEVLQGVWTVRICDFDPESQNLKTKDIFRRIPIHKELVKPEFLQYLCEQSAKGIRVSFPL